jgi:hypothetical protein
MTRANIALLISAFSLGIALATFLWRIVFDVFLDGPRVKVTLKDVSVGGGGPGGMVEAYVVTATNRGRRPTIVTSLWLEGGRPSRWWRDWMRRFMPKKWRRSFFARGLLTEQPEWSRLTTRLPTRLDVGDQAHAYYTREKVRRIFKEHPYRKIFGSAGVTTGRAPDSRPIRLPDDSEPERHRSPVS